MTTAIHHGDCLELIPRLVAEGVVCDAVVTDPPYLLKFMGKRWDDPGAFVERRPDKDNTFDKVVGNHNATSSVDLARTRRSEGAKGQAFHEEWARAVFTIMRPGAFLVAFGGTRTFHRLVCAIEDAGFVIQDTVAWLYGSGFPKNKAQLKPSFEPICLAYKPGKRTMQVNECRIHADDAQGGEYRVKRLNPGASVNKTGEWKQDREYVGHQQPGRWPANVAHDGSDEVLAAFPESNGNSFRITRDHQGGEFGWRAGNTPGFDDSGSAARFFYSSKAGELDRWATQRHEVTISWTSESGPCQAVLLVATVLSPPRVIVASGSITADEWNTFLSGNGLMALFRRASKSTIRMTTSSTTELKTWSWLTRSLTSDFTPAAISSMGNGSNLVGDAESTSLSINFILAETASLPNAERVPSGASFKISGREKRVSHPTVKPISLMRWLVQLVTPPGGTVLDCFAGTGTTGIAALGCGRNAILIEREAAYVADIRERMAWYEGEGMHSTAAKARRTEDKPLGGLFDMAPT